MRRVVFPLLASLCLLLAVSQHTTVAAKDNWVTVRSKNFFMVGNASEKDIKKVALKLEQFRAVFTRLFPNIRFNTPVPTTVVVFKSHSSFGPFKPQSNTAGYFQPGPDINYIALTNEVMGETDPFSVIFHEYTHLLVNNTFPNAPVWFNEGLAEYYSTFKITDDQKVMLGAPISNHVYRLRESKMLPLKTLFEVDHRSPHYNEQNKQSIFYAQSWALVHYLIIGQTGRVEQLSKFLELLKHDVAVDQAFQQAFATPFEVMEKDLRNYVKKDRYNVLNGHFEHKLLLDTDTQATPLTEAEAQAYLGDLLLHSHRKDSQPYLEKALKLDPNLAMAHASLGMLYFREGKVDEARASLERAVAANSQNYLAHYYYAFALSRSSEQDNSVSEYAPEVVARIREHLQRAIALRPDYPESYNLLAFVSLVTGQQVEEAIESIKKVLSASPGRQDFLFTLGQLYVRKKDYKSAREALEQVSKSNADEGLRQHAATLLKQMSFFDEQMARRPPAAVAPEPVVVQTTAAAPSDPSVYLREVLRSPAEGETQLQATLLKIECDAKGVVFVVQTGAGLLRLGTESFDDLDITSYDTGVQGEITCGERKPANPVVVCYLPNTDKRAKADGVLKSIEFVPAEFKLR